MRTAGALVLAVGLSVSGCSSSEAEPAPLPPVSPGAPSVAPVPSPPAEAAAETRQGAEAFARYYFRLISDAYRRADADALRAASAEGCGGCRSLIESVETMASRGEHQIDGESVINEVVAPPVQNGDVVLLVDFSVPVKPFEDGSGKLVATVAAVPRATAQIRLVRRDQSWVVQGYRIVDQ